MKVLVCFLSDTSSEIAILRMKVTGFNIIYCSALIICLSFENSPVVSFSSLMFINLSEFSERSPLFFYLLRMLNCICGLKQYTALCGIRVESVP